MSASINVDQCLCAIPQDFDAPHQKERRHRRFDLQFPVSLSFPSEGAVRELEGISRNVSIGGLLLKVNDPVPVRTRVSLPMEVQGPWTGRPVRLRGEGEVVRVERLESGAGFAIAIACNRPIAELKQHVPALVHPRRLGPWNPGSYRRASYIDIKMIVFQVARACNGRRNYHP